MRVVAQCLRSRWLLPAGLLVWAQYEVWVDTDVNVSGPPLLFALAAAGACAALLSRRTRPLTAVLAVGAMLLVPGLLGHQAESGAQTLMAVTGVYSCGRYGRRPLAYLTLLVAMLLVVAWSTLNSDIEAGDTWLWTLNALWIFGVGAAFRHERHLRDAAASAAEQRQLVAQQRYRAEAAEERLRVARELHDVLAHSLSVIVVQAEVADTLFCCSPDRSRRAVLHVGEVGRAALADIRQLVGLLRDDQPRALPPARDLADIPALVERLRSSGLPVTLRMPCRLPSLTDQVTETAYRVVQESLTNALRHAGAVGTCVDLTDEQGVLVVHVRSAGPGDPRPAGTHVPGHGLVGMRERVASCDGQLTAGPTADGGFQVRAVLPGRPAR